ncbi:Uncharacterised protein [Mycobacteroides abscessus subsp. massiliense]|nr:Uncharacterised protein [Mycobacteroides abscessus subsp. massiliense]
MVTPRRFNKPVSGSRFAETATPNNARAKPQWITNARLPRKNVGRRPTRLRYTTAESLAVGSENVAAAIARVTSAQMTNATMPRRLGQGNMIQHKPTITATAAAMA